MPTYILSRDVNRLLTCQDYDNNILATIDRSNHTGTQTASTISDFCNAVENCAIISNHENRILNLEDKVNGLWGDIYSSGGYLDNLIQNITNSYTGVDEEFVIQSHARLDIIKNAPISTLSLDLVTESNTTIATLGWIKREWSEQVPDGVAWLYPNERGFDKNQFRGIHDFRHSTSVLLSNISDINTPSWEVINSLNLNQALARLNNLPIVSVNLPGTSNWNTVSWTPGEVTIAGTTYDINAGSLDPLNISNSIYYLYYDYSTENVTIDHNVIHENQGLIATIYLNAANQTLTFKQPTLDLSLLARLAGQNIYTGNNTFNGRVRLNNLEESTANYIVPENSDDKTIVNSEWVNQRIETLFNNSYYWRFIPEMEGQRNNRLRVKNGEPFNVQVVDLRNVDSFARTPQETDPDHTIATKGYIDALFESSLGIPIVTLVGLNPPQITWTEGVVNIPSECIEIMNYDHDSCSISASDGSVTLSESTRYIYVDYATCRITFSCDPVDRCVGLVIAVVNCVDGVCNLTVVDGECCETFTGTPTTTRPEDNDCSNRIPTTGWVCDKIHDLIHGQCGGQNFPRVYQIIQEGIRLLSVGVSSGTVPSTLHEGRSILIHNTIDPIGVTQTGTEYVWIRFIDYDPYYIIVVSSSQPTPTEGFLLAVVQKEAGNILNIQHTEIATTETYISANYRAAWGGKLVYVGPVAC